MLKHMVTIGICCLCMSGCFGRQAKLGNGDISAEDFQKQVSNLEAEVASLRMQLAGKGRGAYERGPRAITGRAGDETLLDRLYLAETGLKKAKEDLEERNKSIARLKQSVITNDTLIKNLELKAELFEKNKTKIATLQDNRKVNLKEIDALSASLVEAELQLLKLQSRHFNFAREILEIEPGDMQSFLDLQEKVKQMTLELKPPEDPTSLSQN